MDIQWLWLLCFLLALLLLIVIAELLHRKMGWPSERSRKFLHVSGGLMCLLLPIAFNSHWFVLGLSASAFVLLLFTYRKKMLASVHQVNRYSVGSILFPVPVYVCFLLSSLQFNTSLYYIPVSLLAISDTAAELGGQRWGHRTKSFFSRQKTLAGSLSFLATALPVTTGWLYFGYEMSFANALLAGMLLSLLTCIAELVTLHGWDNLAVPAVALLVLMLVS